MIFDEIAISSYFLIAMFLLYNYLIFSLADSILENPRLKKSYRIPVGSFNVVLALLFTLFENGTAAFSYLVIIIMLSLELYIFYKDSFKRRLFVTLACVMHIMAIRALCIGMFALLTGVSIYEVVNNPFYLVASMAMAFTLLNIGISLIIKYIPFRKIKIINQHEEQLSFILLWLVVFNVYFLINAGVYSENQFTSSLIINQIVASTVIVIVFYITLFFTMKISELLGYKEKNEELEQAIQNEQQYRDSMTKDAIMIYEFNLSQDKIFSGFEEYKAILGDVIYQYRQMLNIMAQKKVHPEDMGFFMAYAEPANIIDQFNQNKSETIIEYRRILQTGEYIWVRAITNLVKDATTGDIKGFTYIKDIDKEKKIQLELTYKSERDSLTGLYNKGTTSKLISEYLKINLDNQEISALFIIDVDNFKSINDHLGHTFGDAVLYELAEKLTKIFRANDIVGRIGGDEFISFMNEIESIDVIEKKAEEICKVFKNTYKNKTGTEYTVSSSIGVAIFPKNGTTFEELYQRSDIALYHSKNNGKNTYTVYNGESFKGYESNRTAIDTKDSLPQKNFKQNKIEYVFKILYESENIILAIEAVLKLLVSHFDFSKAYIFEISPDDAKSYINTFEWYALGVDKGVGFSQIDSLTCCTASFYETGMFVMRKLDDVPEVQRDSFKQQGIQSMIQIGIFEQQELKGFIGFDDCNKERNFSIVEIDEIYTICRVLSTFIVK
ncbi:MAG: sensor domain-containing diguanylate cyclase [Oscillospiraceae bacterium]